MHTVPLDEASKEAIEAGLARYDEVIVKRVQGKIVVVGTERRLLSKQETE